MSNHPIVNMFNEDFRDGRSLFAFVRHGAHVTLGIESLRPQGDLTADDWAKAHKLAGELLAFVRKADST